MFKIILVDDEKYIIDHITTITEWDEFNFCLAGTFTSSTRAIEYVKNNPVDIIVTDIRMPILTGIDVAEEIYRYNPNIQIIFLSAFSEFEYAKEALKYSVCSYITKPLNFSELKQAFKIAQTNLMKISVENMPFNKDFNVEKAAKILNEYRLAKDFNSEKIISKLNDSGLQLNGNSPIAILQIELLDFQKYLDNLYKYEISRFYSSLEKFFIFEGMYIIPLQYSFDKVELIAISQKHSIGNFLLDVSFFCRQLSKYCFQYMQLCANVKISNFTNSLGLLKMKTEYEQNVSKPIALIFDNLNNTNHNEVLNVLNTFFNTIGNNLNLAQAFAEALIIKLIEIIDIETLSDETFSAFFSGIYGAKTTSHIHTAMNCFINNEILPICKSKNSSNNAIAISKAMKYIQDNYFQDITLIDVAHHVFLSSSHFSRLFKKQTGKKYIDYLNYVRIENAKRLLTTTNMKISEISSQVGYSGYTYFLKLFSANTGLTPKEYRIRNL